MRRVVKSIVFYDDGRPADIYLEDVMEPRDPLLQEREKTHGSFSDNARVFNGFRTISAEELSQLTPEQYLAVMMIFLKLARAFQNPNEKDHWADIAGYAKLGEEACE